MKQDIWCVCSPTCIRDGFIVPESTDHHPALVSVASLVRSSPLYECLRWVGKFFVFFFCEGRGCLWELRGGDGGGVMSCCNNKQILMIYYKSAAEASAWGDWGVWQLLTHTPRKCLADDVCVPQIINHWVLSHTHTHTFAKNMLSTHVRRCRGSRTHTCGHTHVSCC